MPFTPEPTHGARLRLNGIFGNTLSHFFLSFLICSLIMAWADVGVSGPATDLSERILLDGFSDEFLDEEAVFDTNETFVREDGLPCIVGGDPPCPREEGLSDSQWGFFNDVNQIKLTWDARFLYLAVDGITWDNNLMLFFDVTRENRNAEDRGPGLPSMLNVNSWRRNITFANDFEPDLFVATWDGNSNPQVWQYQNPRTVREVTSLSNTFATFSAGAEGRSMEAAIPWSLVLQSDSTMVSPAYGDTVPLIPAGFDTLRFVACVTAGGDGTGSPDSAPDNFSGFQVDGNARATLDNFVIVPLDLLDANGVENPDGVPDMPGDRQAFEVSIRDRVTFFKRPPITAIAFDLQAIEISRGVVSPEENYELEFKLDVVPKLTEEQSAGRRVELSAEIYDLRGVRRRVLFRNERVSAQAVKDPEPIRWDGRDDDGRIVEGGIYVLRVVLEPGRTQFLKSFAVIR